MESYKSWLKSCVRNDLTLEQMMFLYLVKMKDFVEDDATIKKYVKKNGTFDDAKVVRPLIKKGFLMDLNSPGKGYPEFMMITEEGDKLFATYAMGEELWDNYPKMFPITGGGSFIARSGIEKDDLIDMYLKKVDYDPTIHEKVMSRLKIYENMVINGQINGHKIVNWVKECMWELIPDDDKPKFGREV